MSDRTTSVVVRGGPAGMIAGLLLARAGAKVTVVEKHGDFFRNFRGDTVHPTTLQLLDESGLLEHLNAIPHAKISTSIPRHPGRKPGWTDSCHKRTLVKLASASSATNKQL